MQDDVPISGYPTTNYMWYTKVVIVILSISDELQASSCRTVTQVWFPSAVFPLDWMWFLCSNIIWFLHKAQNLHLAGQCKLYRAFPEVKVPFHWRNMCVYWPWIWIHNLPVNGSKAMSLSSWPKNCAHIIEFKHLEANYDFPLFTQFSFVPCRGYFHISIKRARQVLCPSSFLRAALIASAT